MKQQASIDLEGKPPNQTLTGTGVVPGTYPQNPDTQAVQFIVDAKGRITYARNIPLKTSPTPTPDEEPMVVTSINLTNRTANIPSANLVGTSNSGIYRVNVFGATQVSDGTAGQVIVTIGWVDTAGLTQSFDADGIGLAAPGDTSFTTLLVTNNGSASITWQTAIIGIYATASYEVCIVVERLV